ncbi:MAG TPA: hypothetical protein VGK31_02325 [Thermoanaerobaculia bacterium]|jgi:hypothetical protein
MSVTPFPVRPAVETYDDLVSKFARAHALVNLFDAVDPTFVEQIRRRLRDEPRFLEDLRRAATEFSILLSSSS